VIGNDYQSIISSGGNDDATFMHLFFQPDNTLGVGLYNYAVFTTPQVFTDVSSWYHLVLTLDTTQAAYNARLRLYVNGNEQTVFSTDNRSLIAQFARLGVSSQTQHNFGFNTSTNSKYAPLEAAEFYFVEGLALDPYSFGNTVDGYWAAIAYQAVVIPPWSTAFPDFVPGVSGSSGGGYSNDPYFSSVVALLHFNGVDGSTTFTDSSFLALTYTTQVSAALSATIWKFDAASLYLQGGFITSPQAPARALGTGDFTIEMWYYPLVFTNPNTLYETSPDGSGSRSNSLIFYADGSGHLGIYGNGGGFLSATPLVLATWSHVAAVRVAGVVTLYLNGVPVANGAFTVNETTAFASIGKACDGGTLTTGYIDDLRVTKAARYTVPFYPVGHDGHGANGSYLDFANASSVPALGYDVFAKSSLQFPSAALPTSVVADTSFSSTALLLSGTGANGGTSFPDTSSYALTVTPTNVVTTTAQHYAYGNSSAYFSGVSSEIQVPQSSTYVGANDFTVECWFKSTNLNTLCNYIFVQQTPAPANNTNLGIILVISADGAVVGQACVGSNRVDASSGPGLVQVNQWYHVSYNRYGNNFFILLNGNLVGYGGITGAVNSPVGFTKIGYYYDNSSGGLNAGGGDPAAMIGYINDFRLSIGVCRYRFGNNWTPVNVSLATDNANAYTYDSLCDAPYGRGGTLYNGLANYPTMAGTLAPSTTPEGYIVRDSAWQTATQSIPATGRWFWEVTVISIAGNPTIGTCSNTYPNNSYSPSGSVGGFGALSRSMSEYDTTVPTYTAGDVLGFAVDVDNLTFAYYKNGVLVGTVPLLISPTYETPFSQQATGTNTAFNFGQQPFRYPIPVGFKVLNSATRPKTLVSSGSFTGNQSADGPVIYTNGLVATLTINGNLVVWGRDAYRYAGGFKVISTSYLYNTSGANAWVATYAASGQNFNHQPAQVN
jgi:hypothetical protein